MEHLGLAMHSRHEQEMRLFAFNMADLADPVRVRGAGGEYPVRGRSATTCCRHWRCWRPSLLVARPLTVLACALPDRAAALDPPGAAVPLLDARDGGGACGAGGGAGRPGCAATAKLYASVVALAIIGTLAPPGATGAVAGRPAGTAGAAHPARCRGGGDAASERPAHARGPRGGRREIAARACPDPPNAPTNATRSGFEFRGG